MCALVLKISLSHIVYDFFTEAQKIESQEKPKPKLASAASLFKIIIFYNSLSTRHQLLHNENIFYTILQKVQQVDQWCCLTCKFGCLLEMLIYMKAKRSQRIQGILWIMKWMKNMQHLVVVYFINIIIRMLCITM